MNRPTATLDVFSPEAYLDESEVARRCKELRTQGRVLWVEQEPYRPFWAVLTREAIAAVERDSRTWLAEPRQTLIPRDIADAILAQWGKRTGPVRTLLDMDGADHRDHRALTQSWFNSRFLETLRTRMAGLARDYVDRLAELGGECDFIEAVAVPYPLIMITSILGLPDSDAPLVLRLTQELFGAQDPERQRSGQYGQDVAMEFFGYLAGVVAQRRQQPTDDLMSVLANATLHGEPLPDIDTLSYGMLLAAAGHDTTSSTVGVGMLQFALNPDQFAKLRADPSLAAPAAQEMFRWATPVRHFLRTAATDTVLGGQPIAAGESVCLMYLSANRDEAEFADPDKFRIDRTPNRHVAFGHGAHRALKTVPPVPGEEALMALFDSAGFGPNRDFDPATLSPGQALGLGWALRVGPQALSQRGFTPTQVTNGWMLSSAVGNPGFDYLLRAEIARGGYVNDPEESIYPASISDSEGAALSGEHRYRIRFAANALPPVAAFWSITAYDRATAQLTENPLRRYAIGDRTSGLQFGADGSLEILLGATPPPEGTSNWLPTPTGAYHLVARLYLPLPPALDGTYALPPVERS